jgi:hypothetical protein
MRGFEEVEWFLPNRRQSFPTSPYSFNDELGLEFIHRFWIAEFWNTSHSFKSPKEDGNRDVLSTLLNGATKSVAACHCTPTSTWRFPTSRLQAVRVMQKCRPLRGSARKITSRNTLFCVLRPLLSRTAHYGSSRNPKDLVSSPTFPTAYGIEYMTAEIRGLSQFFCTLSRIKTRLYSSLRF